MSKFTPSSFQQDIYNFVERGQGSAVINAVAGSGKTTTIVDAAHRIPKNKTCTFVAFNKAIATELATRLPSHVTAKTLNALGFGAWVRRCPGRLTVDSNKTRNIIDQLFQPHVLKPYGASLGRLVAIAKSAGIVPDEARDCHGLLPNENANWLDIISTHDLSPDEGGNEYTMINMARQVLLESIRSAQSVIDFDDQLYMPVITGAQFFRNDFLFVDEAQDTNAIQRRMLRMALKPNGRLIAVGDPFQAIYGFRGADNNAIEYIKRDFSAIELPLSISYRCGRSIIEMAQTYVPHIEHHENAPEGTVSWFPNMTVRDFRPTDVIVCRNSAPLITMAYKIIRQRIACTVVGREIGQGLIALIDKMKCREVEALSEKLQAYYERESDKFRKAKQEQKIDALDDKITTIQLFIEELDEDSRTILGLRNSISALFSDGTNTNMLRLMTIHKSKGLEADRVFILEPGLNERGRNRPEPQRQQEINLTYVAITRAKHELVHIDLEQFDGQQSNGNEVDESGGITWKKQLSISAALLRVARLRKFANGGTF